MKDLLTQRAGYAIDDSYDGACKVVGNLSGLIVLHRVFLHTKVPGWLSVLNALLTRKLPMFLSRLNEISGVGGNVC